MQIAGISTQGLNPGIHSLRITHAEDEVVAIGIGFQSNAIAIMLAEILLYDVGSRIPIPNRIIFTDQAKLIRYK